MWTYEYDDEHKLNAEQLRIASEWFRDRIEEVSGGTSIEGIYFNGDDTIEISYEWDDYCRGCYMDTIRESYRIPNEIFFSDESLSNWIKAEDERRALEKKRELQRKKAEEQKLQREEDRAEYERLKAKFEKED